MVLLQITINCGELSCVAADDQRCEFIDSIWCNTVPVCRLFPSHDGYRNVPYTELQLNEDKELLRCSTCLEAGRERKEGTS